MMTWMYLFCIELTTLVKCGIQSSFTHCLHRFKVSLLRLILVVFFQFSYLEASLVELLKFFHCNLDPACYSKPVFLVCHYSVLKI